jgi:GNAT superfamily N-acetyltransferase
MQQERTARLATEADIPEGAAAFARAFYDDPAVMWLLPDDTKRLRQLTQLYGVLLAKTMRIDFYETYTTDDHAGLAIWGRPGGWEPPTKVMLPVLPKMLRILGPRCFVRYMRTMAAVKKVHPEEPHWYLAGLGTDPPKQRSGVGRSLIAAVLARCDTERLPAYLETQKAENVPYYNRFGFRVTGEIDLPGGGPHLWLMWRDPL